MGNLLSSCFQSEKFKRLVPPALQNHLGPTLIEPSNDNVLPFADIVERPDQNTDPNVMSPARKAAIGTIVFSNALIDETLNGAVLSDKFDLATVTAGAGIFGRCFWPRALRSYALGKDVFGKPAYGAPLLMNMDRAQLVLRGWIDGVEVTRTSDGRPDLRALAVHRTKEGPAFAGPEPKFGSVDFYAWQTTIRFNVLTDSVSKQHRAQPLCIVPPSSCLVSCF